MLWHPGFIRWLVCAAVLLCITTNVLVLAEERCKPEMIRLYEAKLLIYLLPAAKSIRSRGADVAWELQTSETFNQDDYYVFWVVHTSGQWLTTVGYYAVNKHTADVWDDNRREFTKSTELKGVQKILRKAHCIDKDTIKKYRSRSIDAPDRTE